MMRTRIHLLTLLALLLNFGCKDDNGVTIDIESDILIEARVIGGKPELVAQTEEQMPCANHKIRYSMDRDRDRLVIRFRNIIVPDVCLTAFGPASAVISLGSIPAGAYEIRFQLDDETTRGTLTTSPLHLVLESGGNVRLKP